MSHDCNHMGPNIKGLHMWESHSNGRYLLNQSRLRSPGVKTETWATPVKASVALWVVCIWIWPKPTDVTRSKSLTGGSDSVTSSQRWQEQSSDLLCVAFRAKGIFVPLRMCNKQSEAHTARRQCGLLCCSYSKTATKPDLNQPHQH